LEEEEKCAAPIGSFRERKTPHKFSIYVAWIRNIIDSEPSTYEEARK
jgi:hypothetical protein